MAPLTLEPAEPPAAVITRLLARTVGGALGAERRQARAAGLSVCVAGRTLTSSRASSCYSASTLTFQTSLLAPIWLHRGMPSM